MWEIAGEETPQALHPGGKRLDNTCNICILYVQEEAMNTKLTLSIDEQTIGRAKSFARKRNKSLSSLIESYLKAVTLEEANPGEITPLVAELSGVVAEGVQSHRSNYAAYLADKYR